MTILTLPLAPHPDDGVKTESSISQRETEDELMAILDKSGRSPPGLDKQSHFQYLYTHIHKLPPPFASLDASRPWMLYWILHSLDLLGVAVDQNLKNKGIATVLSLQHPSGGFSGGLGQLPHLLPTYASVCSLAILGGGWDQIDRKAMHSFFMSMKRSDGGFSVCRGGEVDVRGVYCLLATATLLDLLTPELVDGTADFVASCQTYEGGFSASPSSISSTFYSPFTSSFPSSPASPSQTSFPTPTPLGEAHGGYTSCAVLATQLLLPFASSHPPKRTINKRALLRWTVHMQASAADGGGFKGRSNKLVDGCYGWWVGGSMTCLEALAGLDRESSKGPKGNVMLYDRAALQEFVLLFAQNPKGGLRDKPGKRPDFYHTANNLAGLSLAQHKLSLSPAQVASLSSSFIPSPRSTPLPTSSRSDDQAEGGWRKTAFVQAMGWHEDESMFLAVGGEANRVNTTHPTLNVLTLRAKEMLVWAYGQKKA